MLSHVFLLLLCMETVGLFIPQRSTSQPSITIPATATLPKLPQWKRYAWKQLHWRDGKLIGFEDRVLKEEVNRTSGCLLEKGEVLCSQG